VLQEKEFRAIGGLAQRSSNFRVIAATNRVLITEVEEKRFRQDLYYRLNVMRLRLAPLRERKEDIPVLISHFLQRYGNDHKVPDEVMDLLKEYEWPGNVRELEHTVQQMVAMNSGPWLTAADLPSTVANRGWERGVEARQTQASSAFAVEGGGGVIPLADVERRAILHAMEVTKGDRTLAAELLGIGRTTLYRKLKEYAL
jgi:transcriptional regulator with PAS, ATPase and Fis domain